MTTANRTYVRPKRCGVCDFTVLGPVGNVWVWCMRCGSVGNGSDPGEWISPDPDVVDLGSRTLRLIRGGKT